MPGARENMWADGRGRFYDVIVSGHQRFAVRTSDETGGCALHEALDPTRRVNGQVSEAMRIRTFELDARGESLVCRCRAGGRCFVWTPTLPMNEGPWPYPLNVERADMHEQHRGVL